MKKKVTWLLIEDDVDDRDIFIMTLTGLTDRVDCITAKNGLEALNLIQRDENFVPACIFVDLNMPLMNGFEFLQQVKQVERLAEVPRIVYTTSSVAKDKERASNLGALFVTKHDTLSGLQKFIRHCISKYTQELVADGNFISKFESKLTSLKKGKNSYKDDGEIFDLLLDSLLEMMNSDHASIQLYNKVTQQLELVGTRNFHPHSIDFWQIVSAASGSVCGEALRKQKGVVISDIETVGFVKEEIGVFRLSGIRAVQSIPLVTPNGELIGMISTHWKDQRQFSENDIRSFEIFAQFTTGILSQNQLTPPL